MKKSRRMNLAGHIAGMEERTACYVNGKAGRKESTRKTKT
jgi:hypothetical protein